MGGIPTIKLMGGSWHCYTHMIMVWLLLGVWLCICVRASAMTWTQHAAIWSTWIPGRASAVCSWILACTKLQTRHWATMVPWNFDIFWPYGGFHKLGYHGIQNGWSTMEHPINMEDLGVPLFQETTISSTCNTIKAWYARMLHLAVPLRNESCRLAWSGEALKSTGFLKHRSYSSSEHAWWRETAMQIPTLKKRYFLVSAKRQLSTWCKMMQVWNAALTDL